MQPPQTPFFATPATPATPTLPMLPDGITAQWQPDARGFRIDMPDGELFYAPSYFPDAQATEWMVFLLENTGPDTRHWQTTNWREHEGETLDAVPFTHIAWQHQPVRVYGKWHLQPRFTAWHGDPHASYTYAGLRLTPAPWNAPLLAMRAAAEAAANMPFNSVLLNWYRDGRDAMGWHADNERALGAVPVIASVSLGATRRFVLRQRTPPRTPVALALEHGSLLVMSAGMQQHWQHAIPRQAGIVQPRLNLTFRNIIG